VLIEHTHRPEGGRQGDGCAFMSRDRLLDGLALNRSTRGGRRRRIVRRRRYGVEEISWSVVHLAAEGRRPS
jgi:hypothetical protein